MIRLPKSIVVECTCRSCGWSGKLLAVRTLTCPKCCASVDSNGREKKRPREWNIEGCGYKWESGTLVATLPFPLSVNAAWRAVNGHTIMSADGRAYRRIVGNLMAGVQTFGTVRLRCEVELRHGDRRGYDLDNFGKTLIDALMHAGVFDDDQQIDALNFRRGPVGQPGRVIVRIGEIRGVESEELFV